MSVHAHLVRALAATVAALALVVVTGVGDARAQGAPACGFGYLPLSEGAQWTYQPVIVQPDAPPAELVITVVSVTTDGVQTVVNLEEKFRDVVTHSQITCDKDQMTISPDSFFFAAEAGGAVLMTMNNVTRKGFSYPSVKGMVKGSQWLEEISADVTRNAAEGTKVEHQPAKIEIERLTEVISSEAVETGIGRFRTLKVKFDLRGRARIGEDRTEIPAKEPGFFWFANNIGVARARDFTGREWQLTATSLRR